MTGVDASLVRRKLATIVRNLDDLGGMDGLALDAYRANRLRLKATERLLQEVVEAAADVNVHLLRAAGRPAPPDYYRSFIEAGGAGLLGPPLAERLAPSAGLRNRLVHEYDAIDDVVVLRAVGEARRLFRDYVAAIERYVGERGF